MSLFPKGFSRYNFTFDNFGANPGATPGTSVVPGASNVEGLFTQIAAAADISTDIYGLYLRVANGSTSAAQRDHLLDIGVDPAGGTAFTTWIPISNIVCGESADITTPGGGHQFFFPLFIPSGSAVAVRIQGSNATPGTVRVCAKFYGKPSSSQNCPVGAYAETVGTITGSAGVTFTPGNAADGAWTDLGATVKDLWWWQVAYQVSNATITAERCYIDIAHGDGTNKHVIQRILHAGGAAETVGNALNANLSPFEAFCPVLAGTHIYIRGRCENAPDTGYNGVAIGIGG